MKPSNMRFDYKEIDSLPRLAWCAVLLKNSHLVTLYHGPWVETRDDCCFEGAWNGPFAAGRFDEADTFTGTGVRLATEGVIFATPSHPVEHLYSVRIGERLVVSNSWVFLLVMSHDQPDLTYANYFFDLRHNYRGIQRTPTNLRTQNGNQVQLHAGCNLVVTPALSIRRAHKKRSDAPRGYRELATLLQTTVKQVVENAIHPARQQCYRTVTMTSTGYDSSAVSALVAQAGCREAVTIAYQREGEERGDDGSLIAQAIRMQAQSIVRFA